MNATHAPERHALLLPPGRARDSAESSARAAGGVVVGEDPGVGPARYLAALERDAVTHVTASAPLLAALCADPAADLTDLDTVRRVVVDAEVPAAASTFPGAEIVVVPAGPRIADVVDAARAAGEERAGVVDAARVRELVGLLDDAVLRSMLAALQAGGALCTPARAEEPEEILDANRVQDRHRPLVRRWLDELAAAGLVERVGPRAPDGGDRFVGVGPVEGVEHAWDEAERVWSDGFGRPAFTAYLRRNAERLPELMTGGLAAATLLFPEGRTDLADEVYRDTVTARYLNAAVAAAVATVEPLRVLEVGAGTAATTEVVLDALPRGVEYVFTDVSPFFLDRARQRFGDRAGLRFAVVDVDALDPAHGQVPGATAGRAAHLAPASVIVAAGVLNAAADVDAAVRGLARLLVPGGWLLVSEPVREHLEILASQAFMMTAPRDDRARTGTSFCSVAQWNATFASAGLETVGVLPAEDHPLAPLGQRLFLVRAPLE